MSARVATKPILVNRYEVATDRQLQGIAAENGDRLLAKVRLADVVDVEQVTGPLKSYALAAHLDFVMVDSETDEPKFAVEFDGARHWSDATMRRRDRMKDQLADEAGLPLLRITSDFLHRHGRWTVLSYVADAYYLADAFYEAQCRGQIPWDEPFDAENLNFVMPDGSWEPNSMAAGARRRLWQAHESGRLSAPFADMFTAEHPSEGGVHGYGLIALKTDRYLFSRVRVRNFRFFGVGPSDVLMQLVELDIEDQVQRWFAGEPVACNGQRIAAVMREIQGLIDAGGFRCSTTCGALQAGGPLAGDLTISSRGSPL